MIGICGNPLCLCRDVAPASKPEWTPYTEEENRLLSEAVREFAEKHGIELEEE